LGAHSHRNARRARHLVAASAVSSLGDGLVLVALPLLAVELTRRPLLVSGIAVAASLPWLLLALPAGALVDRVDRRRLVVVVELARAVVVGLLALGALRGSLSVADLWGGAFLVGAGETVVTTVARATVPLVAGDDVVRVNGLLGAAETVGTQLAGPALGGVVFSAAASLPFAGDALSYLASAALLGRAIPKQASRRAPARRVTADVRAGLRWFASDAALRVLAVVVASFAFCQAMVLAVLVLYARHQLHLESVGYGIFLAVAACGDVAASLLAERVQRRLGDVTTIVGAGAVAGIAYLLLGATSVVYVAGAALAAEAAGSSLGNVATWSVRHRLIPAERFGLVSNAFRMCALGTVPLGALLGGVLTSALGTKPTFVVAGTVQLAVLAVMAPPLRRRLRGDRGGADDVVSSAAGARGPLRGCQLPRRAPPMRREP
jgi:MFS family permease